MSKKPEQTHYAVAWPTLCEDCGQALANDALSRDDLQAFVIYCPHRATLALAFTGEIHGSRGIVRWDVQSPLTENEALKIMTDMAPHAAAMVNLDPARLQ